MAATSSRACESTVGTGKPALLGRQSGVDDPPISCMYAGVDRPDTLSTAYAAAGSFRVGRTGHGPGTVAAASFG